MWGWRLRWWLGRQEEEEENENRQEGRYVGGSGVLLYIQVLYI